MIYLERVRVVQFFLFEKEEFQLGKISAIVGPNGSGKSSAIDAIQIAMFGANSRLAALNAQADDKVATTRTIRAYCLGQYGVSEEDRARDHATTYITLLWRNSETNEPLSMGVCLLASADREGHEVQGRYIIRGVELSMSDHIETVDGKERPRAWATFRHQLIERSKVTGEDPLYTDAERYIKAALLALRGDGAAPSYEAFTRAFRFGLRMSFNKTVDQIVRNEVLESRPTNIKKFKEVTESFRRLAELVARVEKKIADGERVEVNFAKAAEASVQAMTWDALSKDAALESAVDAMNQASKNSQEAVEALHELETEQQTAEQELVKAKNNALEQQRLRESHSAHKDYGALQTEIKQATGIASQKSREMSESISLIRRTLTGASVSPFLQPDAVRLTAAAQSLETIGGQLDALGRKEIETAVRAALKVKDEASSALFSHGAAVNRRLEEANSVLRIAKEALQRISEGRIPLSEDAQRLHNALGDEGVNAVAVCDHVRITDPAWQPVIEAYLGSNVEALLVDDDKVQKAFGIYRSLNGRNAVYNVKIIIPSKQNIGKPVEKGSVAELIEGDNPAAVAFLRRQFGDTRRAATETEALAGPRTLTQDGMLVRSGEITRLRLVPRDVLKIGAGASGNRSAQQDEVRRREAEVTRLETEQENLGRLQKSFTDIPNEKMATAHVLGLWDQLDSARTRLAHLTRKMATAADEEYVLLGQEEQRWNAQAAKHEAALREVGVKVGEVKERRRQCIEREERRANELRTATEASEKARGQAEFDLDYASRQWDALTAKYARQYEEMEAHCGKQREGALGRMNHFVRIGSTELGAFQQTHQERLSEGDTADWRKSRAWMQDLLNRLRGTELLDYKEQMAEAYKTSQDTFRNDVAIALSENLSWLEDTMERLNAVLRECPTFSNGERYHFKRVVRPQLSPLLKFVKDIAAHGSVDDLIGGPGETPEQFKQLLEDKIAPGAAGVRSPLDDYREFFEFDIEILREDPLTRTSKVVANLSKRLGPGSGGEHRAPLYVIAGAALASAYHLDRGHTSGLGLMLIDEAFIKMDMTNIIATMRYLEQLGLQVFMASPGENQGTLTAFLHRYYDILRDPDNNAVMIEGHDVSEEARAMFREDLPEFNPALVEREMAAMRVGAQAAKPAETVI